MMFALALSLAAAQPAAGGSAAPPTTAPRISLDGDLSRVSVRTDPRIRFVEYDPNQIVRVICHTGYQMTIEFSSGERIETVAIGDSTAWQVTPNAAANLVFLKPVALGRPTNLSILTNRRRYNLELVSRPGDKALARDIVYALRFRYSNEPSVGTTPAPAPPPPLSATPPEQWNRSYSYDGSVTNVPEEVFDDGTATFFRFGKDTATPAIFSLTEGAGESVVNFAVRGPYVVVEQVAAGFILRQGKDVTRVYNDGYRTPVPGPDAPKPRTKSKGKRRLFGGS